jgi:hypothetical protein
VNLVQRLNRLALVVHPHERELETRGARVDDEDARLAQ